MNTVESNSPKTSSQHICSRCKCPCDCEELGIWGEDICGCLCDVMDWIDDQETP